ncbi:MAG: 16S rRNA (cytosine(1402)-N(4))-methyltransferase RsmH [Rectinemataceae bacterium]|jgi:16S rRNA (cytosine1402-N4)-methyltransferase
MSDDAGRHIRRRRYRGSHPRTFSEKYKERHPELYREDVERVLARGDTPAGSHRSICVAEILQVLAPKPGETAIDATLGYGGHAKEILAAILPGGRLYGFDLDPMELSKATRRLMGEGIPEGAFVPVHANFARLAEVLSDAGLAGIDLFLADLGVSSMQIDDPDRGFSFKRKGPLDMRMDPERGQSAREYLRTVSEAALREALRANADEAEASSIAHAICLRRERLDTTRDLAEAICSAFPALTFKDRAMQRTLRRSFQAIRIEVNGEFSALEELLASLPSCLNPGARAAILSFHSGEDRRVVAAFREGLETGLYSTISTEAIRPSREEQYGNPRSSSAKLRWAIRSAENT